MPKSPSRRKPVKADVQPSVISLPGLDKQGTAGLTPMHFRVPAQFHREFKVFAAQQGMSMVDLLQQSFHAFKQKRS